MPQRKLDANSIIVDLSLSIVMMVRATVIYKQYHTCSAFSEQCYKELLNDIRVFFVFVHCVVIIRIFAFLTICRVFRTIYGCTR